MTQNCDGKPVAPYVPQEPSAFGAYNMMSGPFFDPNVETTTTTTSRQRSLRDWEENDIPESWGVDAPSNVGKQGKKKDKVRMEKKAREQEEYDDDGWFDKARRDDKSEGKRSRNGRDNRVTSPKKLSFNPSVKWASQSSAPPLPTNKAPKASLLERLGGSFDHSHVPTEPRNFSRKTSYHKSPAGRSHRKREGDREVERERNRDRDRDRDRNRSRRERDLPGPRYTGGYSR
jgi:protein AIR1/2